MRKLLLASLLSLALAPVTVAQLTPSDHQKIKTLYETADELFFTKKYTASLEYLNKEGAAYLPVSDSLQYLKIKNLEALHRSSLTLTKELETSLRLFFSKGNKYSFPELKYAEISQIFSSFQGFKTKDKQFYDSVSKVTNLEKPETLPAINSILNEYLKNTPNTYYSKELNDYISAINTRLTQVALARKKYLQDSTNRSKTKNIGKKMNINFSYQVSSSGPETFTPMNSHSDVQTFFGGKYTGELGQKNVFNLCIGVAMANIYTGNRAKLSIEWNVLDAEYAIFDWVGNSFLKSAQSSGSDVKKIRSIKAGTRIGPMLAFLVTKSMGIGLYYNARPGVQFWISPAYYLWNDGTGMASYSVKSDYANYNFSNEVGLKLFLGGRVYLNPYLHFGTYNWKSDLENLTKKTTEALQANYKFSNIGIRLGL